MNNMLYITGATGHSGQWLMKRLEQEKYEGPIRVVIRKSKEEAPNEHAFLEDLSLQLDIVVGDLRDSRFLEETLEGVDTVIHTASVTLSPLLVEIALTKKVDWLILVHTTGRYSKYKSASQEYIQIEDQILEMREKGLLNVTILRPTMIYGSHKDRNMYRLVSYLGRHKLFPVFGKGDNLMQPVHAKDLGDAYYQVLTNRQQTLNQDYNLSGKDPISYIQLLKTISTQLSRNTVFIHIPLSLAVFLIKIYNLILPKKAILSVEQVLRMNEDKCFDHSRAEEDFGYKPFSFEEGIQEEVKEYLQGIRYDFSNVRYR